MNLQNIPVRTELARKLRDIFSPPVPALMEADYESLERRVWAHVKVPSKPEQDRDE